MVVIMKKYILYFLLNGIVFSLPMEAQPTYATILKKTKDTIVLLNEKSRKKVKGAVEALKQNHTIQTVYGYSMPIISGACIGVTWFMYGKYKKMKEQVGQLQASLSQIQSVATKRNSTILSQPTTAPLKQAPPPALPPRPVSSLAHKRVSGQPDVHLGGASIVDTDHPQVSVTSNELEDAKNHLKGAQKRPTSREGVPTMREGLKQAITGFEKNRLNKAQQRVLKEKEVERSPFEKAVTTRRGKIAESSDEEGSSEEDWQ